jgi:hypothetical protein
LGRSLTEKTPFGGFSAGLCRLNQLAAVAEILVFGRLAAIFAEFDFAGLLNRQRFVAKKVRLRLTLILRPSLRNGTG